MIPARLQRYNAAIEHSGLLAPAGMFGLIDMQRLTHGAARDAALLCRHHDCAKSLAENIFTALHDPHWATS